MVINANENHVAFLFFFGSRGEILSDMGLVGTFPKVITAIVRHRRFVIVPEGGLMKSFAGFLPVVVFSWLDNYSSWGLATARVEFTGDPMLLLRDKDLQSL